MTTTDNGGPAFPTAPPLHRMHADGTIEVVDGGMSLRDWFAGQALVGLASDFTHFETLARDAYAAADAMLAERAKASGEADGV